MDAEKKVYCMNCFSEIDVLFDSTCAHCGWRDEGQVTNALPFGTVLCDRYLIGQAVRVNGAGITYHALERKTNAIVEVREFYPYSIAYRSQDKVTVHPAAGAELKYSDYLSEFERYNQKLISISGTMRIPVVLDSFSANNTQYIVFQHEETVSLRSYVEKNGVLDWAECEQLFMPVIQALGTVHGQGLEHFGISPETLRVTDDNKMLLTEFEMPSVRRVGTDLPEDNCVGCWALEQYSKTKICDEVTDVYGLCASLLFALTGALPAEAVKRRDDPRLMISRSVLKKLPEPVIPAIANALQVDADRRTSSFSRFAAELTAQPMVMEKVVETQTVRTLPYNSRRNPNSKNLPPFAWLVISFVVSLCVIFLSAEIWFKDSPFTLGYILKAFEEPDVSAVSQTIKLPNLVGEDFDKIERLTQTNGEYAFELKIYEEVFDDNVPDGKITNQLPFAGSLIKAGDTVKVAVSRGSSVRVLPEIAGQTKEAAFERLRTEGFAPVQVKVVSSTTPVGCVIEYKTGMPGDKAAYGSVVEVLVSVDASDLE